MSGNPQAQPISPPTPLFFNFKMMLCLIILNDTCSIQSGYIQIPRNQLMHQQNIYVYISHPRLLLLLYSSVLNLTIGPTTRQPDSLGDVINMMCKRFPLTFLTLSICTVQVIQTTFNLIFVPCFLNNEQKCQFIGLSRVGQSLHAWPYWN